MSDAFVQMNNVNSTSDTDVAKQDPFNLNPVAEAEVKSFNKKNVFSQNIEVSEKGNAFKQNINKVNEKIENREQTFKEAIGKENKNSSSVFAQGQATKQHKKGTTFSQQQIVKSYQSLNEPPERKKISIGRPTGQKELPRKSMLMVNMIKTSALYHRAGDEAYFFA